VEGLPAPCRGQPWPCQAPGRLRQQQQGQKLELGGLAMAVFAEAPSEGD